MVLAVLLLLAGAAVLGLGAGALTRGVARTLFAGGASPRVVGLVLLGVQAGPLLATLLAAARGTPSFAVGSPSGRPAYLVCGGLGAGLLLGRRPTPSPPLVAVLLPGLPLVSAAIVVSDGWSTASEGLGLLILFAVFQYVMAADRRLVEARGEQLRKSAARGLSIPPAGLTGIGVAAAVVGAVTLLWGGRTLVGHSGLAAGFVAAAIVGPLSALGGLRSCLPGDRHRRRERGGRAPWRPATPSAASPRLPPGRSDWPPSSTRSSPTARRRSRRSAWPASTRRLPWPSRPEGGPAGSPARWPSRPR